MTRGISNTRYIVILFFGVIALLRGQDTELIFHHLSGENGLPQSEKYYFSMDSQGFIWIGTNYGLLRYDGHMLKTYQTSPRDSLSIIESRITSKCFEDLDGNLWFSTFGSISCYRRITDDFIHFSLDGSYKNLSAFYLDDEHGFWFKVNEDPNGAYFVFDLLTEEFNFCGQIEGGERQVVVDNSGKVRGILNSALNNADGMIWRDFKNDITVRASFTMLANGNSRNFSSPTEKSYVENDSVVWVGLYDGVGRYVLGDTVGVIYNEKSPDIVSDIGWVYDVAPSVEGQLFVATTKGLFLFDISKERFVHQFHYNLDDPYSLQLTNINELYLSESGVLFLSNSEQEMAFTQLSKGKFSGLKEPAGHSIISIAEDGNGRIWCSTVDDGTYIYSDKKEMLLRTDKLYSENLTNREISLPSISQFVQSENDWWGQYFNNFLRWNADNDRFEMQLSYFLGVTSNVSDRVNFYYQLSDGTNLAAIGPKIYKLELTQERVDTTQWLDLVELNLNNVMNLYEDRAGRVYINDDYGRLTIIIPHYDGFTLILDQGNFGTSYSYLEDTRQGIIWIATSEGLVNIDSNFSINYEKSISNQPLYGILMDSNGLLWMSSNNGLLRYDIETQYLDRFGVSDGLLSPVLNSGSMLMSSRTGEIWIGGKNGVNVFHPDDIKLMTNKPNIYLSDLMVNDEPHDFGLNITETDNFRFDHSDNTLSFQFVALDYSDPSANEYYYQMEGIDQNRVANGNLGFARYANLPSGDYTFKVWATNSDKVLNETPMALSILILPPFYQTWWFLTLCFMAISAIVYGVFQYRLRQALKVERLRVKISSDLHDDVGGLLSGLAMQSEILELTAEEQVKPKLRRISELSRSAMSRMRDTVWAIDARKDKLENLIDRMREHGEETLEAKGIALDIHTDGLDVQMNLPVDVRQNVYLIYKEAVTNVAKHSNATRVEVLLKKEAKTFLMRISDDGTDIDLKKKSAGLGLLNMKMRAERLNALLDISVAQGYTIILQFGI